MIYDPKTKKLILERLKWLNQFIRSLEDFGDQYRINVADDKIYITANAQRNMLRELLENKFH
jgi:hypothetical protein